MNAPSVPDMTRTVTTRATGAAGAAPTTGPTDADRRTGIALMLTSSAANQTGAALGARAFDAIGPVGVVAVRQFITAAILVPLVRPRFRLRRDQWWPVIGLVVVFSVMNLSLYAAVERIGLGLAVTLEFLGPLTVAIAGSRRAVDACGALIAGVGVLLLTRPGGSADLTGVGLGLLAASAWGAYILLNRTCGRRLPGLQGTAVASVFTAAVWIPVAAVWFLTPPSDGSGTGTGGRVRRPVLGGALCRGHARTTTHPGDRLRHLHQREPGVGGTGWLAVPQPVPRRDRRGGHRPDRGEQRGDLGPAPLISLPSGSPQIHHTPCCVRPLKTAQLVMYPG